MSIIIKSGSSGNLVDVSSRKAILTEDVDYKYYSGVYKYISENLVIQTAAHVNNVGGFFWMFNYIGSGKIVRVKQLKVVTSPTAATVFTSAPRLMFSLMTVSGSPVGTPAYPTQFDSSYPWSVMDIRLTSTGLSFVYGYPIYVTLPIVILTAVGVSNPAEHKQLICNEKCDIILREGQGLVFWQPDAGSTADTRKVISEVLWAEYVSS